jgi:hypothetical protein
LKETARRRRWFRQRDGGDLLLNIQSRSQPFGISEARQRLVKMSSICRSRRHAGLSVPLDCPEYPASLTYDPDLPDEAVPVACTLWKR